MVKLKKELIFFWRGEVMKESIALKGDKVFLYAFFLNNGKIFF